MTPVARLSACLEILTDLENRRRPVADALKDWGLSHRFAGSKDRAALASLVYDVLRRRSSAGWLTGDRTPRGQLLGMLKLQRGLNIDEIQTLWTGERFAPPPLTDKEKDRLTNKNLDDAPLHIQADVPDWVFEVFQASFGENAVTEAQALAKRATLDVRVNSLKTNRETLQKTLHHLSFETTPLSPWGLRIDTRGDDKAPSLQVEPEFLEGHFEIQDEGSQIAALLSGAKPGERVADMCAGAGGKTLALGAMMQNQGYLAASDADIRRLAPIHERLKRAGLTCVDVKTPRGSTDVWDSEKGSFDLVIVDAPCTGSGTWRRNPDAKWRLRPNALQMRINEQAKALQQAQSLVRSKGRLVYVTCSIFPQENDESIHAFLDQNQDFSFVSAQHLIGRSKIDNIAAKVYPKTYGLQLTPLKSGTDGFYISVLERH